MNAITELKYSIEGLKHSLDQTEEKINKLGDTSVKDIHSEEQKGKKEWNTVKVAQGLNNMLPLE